MTKISVEAANLKAGELNVERANVIQEVMRLRHEQARIKAEIVKLAADSGDLSILRSVVACW